MSKTNGIASADRTGGCAFPIGSNQICGETQTLEIIKQFRKLYEDKLQQIQSGGDQENSLQAKISLQQDWIKDLTEQNDMLVRAVEELETDATDRVAMLEEKLRKSAQQGNEVMQKLEDKERMLRQSQEILNRFPIDAEALAVRLQEKDQELSTLRRISVESSADGADLRIRVKELEEENQLLQKQIEEAKGEVQVVYNRANEMTGQLVATTQEHEQERRQSTAIIEALQRENAQYQRKSVEIGVQNQNASSSEVLNLQRDAAKEALEKEHHDREVERLKHNEEISNLKQTISELEKALKNTQVRGENLQKTGCMCGLQTELIKLREDCKQQIKTNSYLKQQLVEVSCACKSMRNMESEAIELQKMLQRVNGDLHHQADVTKQELLREAQLNNIKAEQIEELQEIVDAKTTELNQCAGECCKVKQQLTLTMQQNLELQAELAQFKSQIENYRETAATSEELSQFCKKEIEKCKCNITELSNRYMQTKDQLQQKTEMCSKLDAELCAQNNNCMCLQQEVQDNKIRYEIDQSDLRNTINDLTDKLAKSENNYQILHENFRQSQDEILEITQRKAKLQLDNEEYTATMHKLKQQELGLGECVCQLESEGAVLKKELMEKDRQMEMLQEERTNLKNELDKILQRYNKLKSEHEQLHKNYEELNSGLSKSEYQSHVTKEQFNQCLCGLQAVHMEKDRLESKNRQLQMELEKLQHAYEEIGVKYKKLSESVVTLEMKLLDNNMCREEICAESRNVISNVRAWLQNQTTINEELTQKLRDDEILIEHLKQQISMSRSQSKCKKCYCNKVRERGGGLSTDRFLRLAAATTSQPNLWSPGSQGSGGTSPVSLISNTQEWYAYEEFGEEGYIDDDLLLSHCLKRVESINEELEKSNRFWLNKMKDHDYLVTRDQ